eukprot:1158371-Pelagomonas_calceolata.AAC.13
MSVKALVRWLSMVVGKGQWLWLGVGTVINVGWELDEGCGWCDNPYDTRYRPERIIIYDNQAGGIGIAQMVSKSNNKVMQSFCLGASLLPSGSPFACTKKGKRNPCKQAETIVA